MQSLQSRLSTGLLLSLIICFSALWLLVSINVEFLSEEYIASRIQHDTETLLSTIDFDSENKLVLDSSRIDLVYHQPFSGHYYVINTSNQHVNSRSLWDQSLNIIKTEAGVQQRSLQQGPEQQSLLVVSNSFNKKGNQISISIAEDLGPIQSNIKQFQYWFAVMAFSMLFILVILQILILRSSLKPLTRTQSELKSLEQGKLDKLSTDSPSELRPLINEVNHLLSVVEQRLRRSRDASSDLAHAIKKPLTVIQQLTDKNDIPDETKDILKKQTNDIFQLTDRILKRARLAGHSYGGALFSFSKDLPDLINTLDMIYASKSLKITKNIQDNLICPIDREDTLELLGNVLDNAYKWSSSKINLTVNMNSDLHIRIEDDGPGADPEKTTSLATRGVRLDEKMEGHGFGLAITADIVNDYRGKISFSRSEELGGFRTDILLPVHNQ
ncbi:MAG: sensor histidine kinase [Gammaproteobacteria bacterium]|nr:sensor histidine kinase [Gammaproteobacteria bacterium]